ncbi:MAG: PEP-CTERM sorting domain-containing protein, partial [Phycisphaerales bacterium]|nr:PEP-CTERM sorting domain-containing protein [Phycisphaerales bacterium]
QRNTTFGEVEYRDTIFMDDELGIDHPLITQGSPPLTAIFNPLTPLSTFAGENPNGIWQLVIIDDQPFDAGTIYRPGSTVSWASSPSPAISQGTKITIVSIPEPASAMLLLAGAGCLMGRNRRRA